MAKIINIFLKLFFHLLYHRFAWSYDAVAWLVSGGKWTAWGREILPYLKGTKVLELGHGPGHLQAHLAQKGYRTYGLDASPQMTRLAHRRLSRLSIPHRIVLGASESLPFKNESFDSLLAVFPTEYIFNPHTVLEITRVLRPGGAFVVLVGVDILPNGIYNRLLSYIYRLSGQATPPGNFMSGYLERLHRAGLRGGVEWRSTPDCRLLFLVCTKEV